MATGHTSLPPSFARFLSDAERWAEEGDRERARRVLALAADLATPARVPAVLLSWHAAGDAPPPAALRPAPAARPAPLPAPELDPAGLPIPDFPTAPPTVDLAAPRGMALAPPPFAAERREEAPPPPPAPLPPLEPRAGGGGVLKGVAVAALVAGAVWMYLPADLKSTLRLPTVAAGSAASAEQGPDALLAHGRSLLAAGDTAGAAAALASAARGDSRGAVAWDAAGELSRLPGRAADAADAYLLAFAAGLPADRAETVARAQERAGRPDRARRVREQAAGR